MRTVLAVVVALFGLAAQGASAQGDMGAQQMSMGSNQSIMAAMQQPVVGQPYQAEKVSRSVQKLSDGTVITHEWKGLIARDTAGRMREELYLMHSGQIGGREGDASLQSATVGDPVAHTMLIWTGEKAKVAMRMQLPSLPSVPKGAMAGLLEAPPPPLPPGGIAHVGTTPPLTATSQLKDEVRTEDLGKQSIEGVLVTGRRQTTTIATGKLGNDRPIVVVHEEWRSPELKILVKTIDADPRTGEQTMDLQGLVRTDPDAALFQAPEGYQVKDMAEMLKALGAIGKSKTP